jgi:hypothetical protein
MNLLDDRTLFLKLLKVNITIYHLKCVIECHFSYVLQLDGYINLTAFEDIYAVSLIIAIEICEILGWTSSKRVIRMCLSGLKYYNF